MAQTKKEFQNEEAVRAFFDIRDSARRNGLQDMSLEEINEEISKCREKYNVQNN